MLGISRVHRDSITNFNEHFAHEENWRGSSGNFQASSPDLMLGPGQKKPNYPLTYSKYGDLFLEFNTSRSMVDIRVRCLISASFFRSIYYIFRF